MNLIQPSFAPWAELGNMTIGFMECRAILTDEAAVEIQSLLYSRHLGGSLAGVQNQRNAPDSQFLKRLAGWIDRIALVFHEAAIEVCENY